MLEQKPAAAHEHAAHEVVAHEPAVLDLGAPQAVLLGAVVKLHERVRVGGAEAGAVVGALAELCGVDKVPHLLLVLDGDVAGLEVLGDLGDNADLVLGALLRVARLGPPGEVALLGEGAGVVEVLGLEALVGVLGRDEGEGPALEEGRHPGPVGREGEAHVAAVEVGEGVEALGVGPEVVGAARALQLPELVGLWPRGHLCLLSVGGDLLLPLKKKLKRGSIFFLREAVAAVYMLVLLAWAR